MAKRKKRVEVVKPKTAEEKYKRGHYSIPPMEIRKAAGTYKCPDCQVDVVVRVKNYRLKDDPVYCKSCGQRRNIAKIQDRMLAGSLEANKKRRTRNWFPRLDPGTYKCGKCGTDVVVKPKNNRHADRPVFCRPCTTDIHVTPLMADARAKNLAAAELQRLEAEKQIVARVETLKQDIATQTALTPDDELLLKRTAHMYTQSIVTPEQVEEIKRNIAFIRADVSHLPKDEQVKRELLIRELCRRKLIYFTCRRRPEYEAGWFNIDLAERLEKFGYDIIAKKSPRMIVAAPPRSGKSALSSEDFPSWLQGHMPKVEIIASSYNDELAGDFSRAVQNIMREPQYKAMFDGLTVSDWSKSVDAWENSKHGKYRGVGVGGSLTGRGANCLIIEDPLKDRQQADSALQRKRIWDWYTSTAYTRLLPGGGVLVIMTRWSHDDLTGRLLEQLKTAELQAFKNNGEWPEDADKWEVVSYPAIAVEDEVHRKEGEALHPERYSRAALMKIRRTQTLEGDPRDWAALYQQTPVLDEGAYFTKEMIQFYDHENPKGMVLAAGDLALSKEQWADYTVFLIGVLAEDDTFYIFHGVRFRGDSEEIINEMFSIQEAFKPAEIGLGKDVIEKSLGPTIDRRIIQERRYDLIVTSIPHQNLDKPARARAIQARMKKGKVKLRRGAPFLEWFLPEVLVFPNGRKDDVVDSLANFGYMLNERKYTPPPEPHKASWRDRLMAPNGEVASPMAA